MSNGDLTFLMKQIQTMMVVSTSMNGKLTMDSWKKSLKLKWEVPILLLNRCYVNHISYTIWTETEKLLKMKSFGPENSRPSTTPSKPNFQNKSVSVSLKILSYSVSLIVMLMKLLYSFWQINTS